MNNSSYLQSAVGVGRRGLFLGGEISEVFEFAVDADTGAPWLELHSVVPAYPPLASDVAGERANPIQLVGAFFDGAKIFFAVVQCVMIQMIGFKLGVIQTQDKSRQLDLVLPAVAVKGRSCTPRLVFWIKMRVPAMLERKDLRQVFGVNQGFKDGAVGPLQKDSAGRDANFITVRLVGVQPTAATSSL